MEEMEKSEEENAEKMEKELESITKGAAETESGLKYFILREEEGVLF